MTIVVATWRHRARSCLALGVLLVTAAACTDPTLTEEAPPTGAGADEIAGEPVLDPTRDELLELLQELEATVAAAQAELTAAAGAEDAATSRTAAAAALALLLDDPDAPAGDQRALFPARTIEREESVSSDDLLNAALTAARRAGGELGRATVEVLREPVAGDLGAWERDAEGVVASAVDAVRGARDVDAVAEDVLALSGDGLRALAWTLLATEAGDAQRTRAAAERALAHLGVVSIGLTLLDTGAEDTGAEDTGAGPGAEGDT